MLQYLGRGCMIVFCYDSASWQRGFGDPQSFNDKKMRTRGGVSAIEGKNYGGKYLVRQVPASGGPDKN